MKKKDYVFKTRLSLSVSVMMLFALGMRAQCPSVNSITATPANVCLGGNSQLQVSMEASYTVTSIPYAPIATPGSGVTTLCDTGTVVETDNYHGDEDMTDLDEASWSDQAIPFDFSFFGTTYTSFSVGTNGYIFLGSGPSADARGITTNGGYNRTLPNRRAVSPSIGGIYSDLTFNFSGTINYFVTGSAPNRILVINYTNGQFFTSDEETGDPSSIGSVTTQILLYETTNVVEVHTANSTGDNNAVEGIQNETGFTAYTVDGRNNELWSVSTPDAYRFQLASSTYSWSPSTYLDDTTLANPAVTGINETTTYIVTVETEGGCSTTASIDVNVSPLNSDPSASPSNTVCSGTSVRLSANPMFGGEPYTFSWNGPGDFSSSDENPVIDASESTAGTYTVTVTDNCDNLSTSTIELTVNPLPSVSVSPSSSTLCNGTRTAITLDASGTATSYSWSPEDGLDGTSGTEVSATPVSTTTFTVVGTDDNGCSAFATAVVNRADAPVVSATATSDAICFGATTQLDATANYSSSTYEVTAVPFSLISASGDQTVLAAGGTEVTSVSNGDLDEGDWEDQALPFTFNYFGTDYTSFAVSTNGFITLGAGAPSTYGGAFTSLPSTDAALNSISAVNSDLDFNLGGLVSYFVNGEAPNRVFVVNFIGQFYDGSGGYVVSQIQLYETTNAVEVHIATSPEDNEAVEGIQNSDGTIAYTVGSRNGSYWSVGMPDAYRFEPASSPSYTYAWTPGESVEDATISNPMTNALMSATDFSVVVTAANGCSATGLVSVTINPVITIAPVSTICLQADPVTLTATPTGGMFTGPGVDSLAGTFNPLTAGVGSTTVTYTVTEDGCTGSLSQSLDVEDCTGITENTFTQDVNMYPNPTTGTFSIEIPNANFSEMKISIIDPQGKEVYNAVDRNANAAGYKRQINLENLAKGIYFIKLSTDKGVKVKKLTLQ